MTTRFTAEFTEPASIAGGRCSMSASVAQLEEHPVEARSAPVRIGFEAPVDLRDCAHVDSDGIIWLNPTREGQTEIVVPVHPDSFLARMVYSDWDAPLPFDALVVV